MGKSKSTGKARLDKYYNLAKEKGYRARSAFKLLQMNRKYGFLGGSHILIDLCAAPGGWLQVAAQEMPPRRKIIGIDLEPIKFIGDVDTFVSDITTEECRLRLREILGTYKADVVLHDGAPNVGTSWENDAFNQNLLVLHSTKLATEFLREGGVFVTKVFRSRDYSSLFNALSKLFATVETSKPLSSRSQSAEIFLVCMDFVGEDRADRSILDPSAVFQDEKSTSGGYEDFNFHKVIKFTDFLKEEDPHVLSQIVTGCSEIVVDLESDSIPRVLDDEFLYLFKDLQVLGKGDIKKILNKRMKIVRSVQNGELDVAELEFLKDTVDEVKEELELKERTMEEKLEEIYTLIEKNRRQKLREEALRREKTNDEKKLDCFFEDVIFEKLKMVDEDEHTVEVPKDDRIIEVSSCSDSLDLDEEEMMCIAKLKENPEGFIEDTIDRYIRDPNERLPNYLREDEIGNSRRSKADERRLSKKEREALSRRKTRAERRAEKFMKNVIADDSEEEGEIAKKVYKSSYRKTKTKPRIVFPKRHGYGVPRGKGKLVALDRRMKKDKRR